MNNRLLAALALCALCACTGGGGQSSSQTNATAGAPPLKNTTTFPLYGGAKVVGSRTFTQTVQTNGSSSVFSAGSGTYSGSQVIASSAATFAALSSWIAQLAQNPPPGYRSVERAANNPNERAQAENFGIDYGTFTHDAGGKTHGVLVVVMDPQRVNRRFGAVLGLIAKYRSLPAIMRGPIDDEAKSRIGMTLTQVTDPGSPVGGALDALDQFQHTNARGIILIDAVKK